MLPCQAAGGRSTITARQLESLVRLSEARARLELRDTVTQQDALDAVEVMKQVGAGAALAELSASVE